MSDDGNVQIWGDRSMETTQKMKYNQSDLTVVDRMVQEWTFVNFSVPWDRNVVTKEDKKIGKYSLLAKEIRKMQLASTKIMSLVVYCLDRVSGWLECFFKDLGIPNVLQRM